MKRVFSCEDSLTAGHVLSLLQLEGVAVEMRNQNLAGAMGELPPIECWPEIWVRDDRDADRAEQIIGEILAQQDSSGPGWTCHCGEQLDGQFSACWHCGCQRDREPPCDV